MHNPGDISTRFNLVPWGVKALLAGGVLAIAVAFLKFGIVAGAIVALIPASLCILWFTLRNPAISMLGLFAVNYFIMGVGRSLPDMPVGTILDAAIFYNIAMVLVQAAIHRIDWKSARSPLTLVAVLWMVYCLMELFNPNAIPAAWLSSARSYAFYFLSLVLLTQLTMNRYKYLKYMLTIWAILTLLAVAKACYQKYVGFTPSEKYWLYILGGQRTHIIYSGIRYFSFFSDAANFGGSMGQSMVVFSIASFFYRNPWMKLFLLVTAAAACYGMLISGTRSALAVPFVGYTVFVLLSRNVKVMVAGVVVLIGAFVFLNFTTIGNSNATIRRARSAFDTEDASLNVRLDNQAKLRVLMADKPFGNGLGLGGGKAKTYAPNAPISQIPTDSWFVLVWVETGIVGLILHICTLLFMLGWGAFHVVYRIRDPQLKGLTSALICGISGVVIMSYANEIYGQIPTGSIIYISMAFIFLSPRFDRELAEAKAARLAQQKK